MTKTGSDTYARIDDEGDSIIDWLRAHSRVATTGAIAVVAIGLTIWLWRGAAERKEVNAGRSLGEAQRAFASGNMALAQSDLQRVVQRYGGTTSSHQARLLLAQAYFAQGKVPEGLKVLDEAGNPKPFESSFHNVRAAGLEQAGKPAEAAQEYLKAAETAVGATEKADFKSEAARAFTDAGNAVEAQKLWAELAADYMNPLAAEASLRWGELTARSAAKSIEK